MGTLNGPATCCFLSRRVQRDWEEEVCYPATHRIHIPAAVTCIYYRNHLKSSSEAA